MVSQKVDRWILENKDRLIKDYVNNTRFFDNNIDDEVTEFVDIFDPIKDIELVPFILFSKLVNLFGYTGLDLQLSFDHFYNYSVAFANFASLGDYAKHVFTDELIDSIDWRSWRYQYIRHDILFE